MATILRSVAAAVNKGPPSTYYGSDNNPVFQSLEHEINMFSSYMKKRTAAGYRKPADEPSSRA